MSHGAVLSRQLPRETAVLPILRLDFHHVRDEFTINIWSTQQKDGVASSSVEAQGLNKATGTTSERGLKGSEGNRNKKVESDLTEAPFQAGISQ